MQRVWGAYKWYGTVQYSAAQSVVQYGKKNYSTVVGTTTIGGVVRTVGLGTRRLGCSPEISVCPESEMLGRRSTETYR